MRAMAPRAMMQDRAICFHRRVGKLAVICQRLFQPRKPTCAVCSISTAVKRQVGRTTHASSSAQSQLDQLARRLARVAAAHVAQTQPTPTGTVRGSMEVNAATTLSLVPISVATIEYRLGIWRHPMLRINVLHRTLIRMPAKTGTKTPKNCTLRVLLIHT